jgi:ABC-type phosphate/phosphonate transport system permease subunit
MFTANFQSFNSSGTFFEKEATGFLFTTVLVWGTVSLIIRLSIIGGVLSAVVPLLLSVLLHDKKTNNNKVQPAFSELNNNDDTR